jgi:hypothetical protein
MNCRFREKKIPNEKTQISNKIQYSKVKIVCNCFLTFEILTFIWHLDFVIQIYNFIGGYGDFNKE